MNTAIKLDILSKYPNVKHAISTKAFGSMKKENGELHAANLLKFGKLENFATMPITMNQVHGNQIVVVENSRELTISQTDGVITNQKDLPLAIKTADCLPVMFYAPEGNVIGAVHAGRRGLAANVLQKALFKMNESFGVEPQEVIVGIGPNIEKYCYEVSKEIIDEFTTLFPAFDTIYEEKDGAYFLDLRSVALQILLEQGVLKENISISEICTKCDNRFFSYRRGDRNGLFVSVISLG